MICNSRNVILFLLIFFAWLRPGNACINRYYYSVDQDGEVHQAESELGFQPFRSGFDNVAVQNQLKESFQQLIVNRTYMALSDYAVNLMQAGKNKEALKILQVLYVRYPGEYQLASNLGTAYELNGENDSALKYIKRGMELYPAEHDGSEWIHVKILEAKIRISSDPGYLLRNRVLGLTKSQLEDSLIGDQIELQLLERFPFCQGPDPVMAQLFTDLADITMHRSIEVARGYYQIAAEYYGDTSSALQAKLDSVQVLLKKYASVNPAGENERILNLGIRNFIYYSDSSDIDWTGLSSDPAALLAYVDMNISVEEAYAILRKTIPGVEPPGSQAQTSAKSALSEDEHEESILLISTLLFVALIVVVFAFKD